MQETIWSCVREIASSWRICVPRASSRQGSVHFFTLYTLCWKKCKKSVPRSCKQRWPLCIRQHTAKTGTNTYQSCLLNQRTVIILCESLTRNRGHWELFYNYYIIIRIVHLAGSSQEPSVARDVLVFYVLRIWSAASLASVVMRADMQKHTKRGIRCPGSPFF